MRPITTLTFTDLKYYHILLGGFCLMVCLLSIFTVCKYPGHKIVYVVFTVILNALFIFGFTKNRIFFDTFIGIFFWLGFWLKFSVRVAFMRGEFFEHIGQFSGTGAAFDRALAVSSCGVGALLIANFVRRRFFFTYAKAGTQPRHEATFIFYQRRRTIVLALFFCFILVVPIVNAIFGIYQRGFVPRTFLPFGVSGVYTWLLLFGMASGSAVILDCEFRRNNNPYLASFITLLECFASNASMLSRGMILNGGALIIGGLENIRRRSVTLSFLYKALILIVFGVLFVSSVFVINHLRGYVYSRLSLGTVDFSSISNVYSNTRKLMIIDRWVGMEGVMAVSSYPDLGWDLWKRAWRESFSNSGTSMYDLTFIESSYLNMDKSKHHFVSLPGILAFFFYPGSYVFLFICMLFLGLLGAVIEMFVYRLGGANIILCSLLAQVVAYRYAHFGYAPNQSYLLFGSVFLNVLIIFLLNKFLSSLDEKRCKKQIGT